MATLRRELGKWDLTALGVNQVIGGAVFLMPAIVARQIGAWSWIGVAIAGVMSMAIALNFAEAGSRFDATGGPYLYTRRAFGSFVGFELGWMQWVTRVTSWATVVNGLVDAVGYYSPSIRAGGWRVVVITTTVAIITFINVLGIRQSAIVVNTLTIGKVVPLAIFIVFGLPHVVPSALQPHETLTWAQVTTAALYLIFAFGGYDTVPVPAGEARNPARDVPFAMVMSVAISGTIMCLAQVVALGVLPNILASTTPLADAAVLFLGGGGALLLTVGAVVSTSGNNLGGALAGSRILYALAERGDVPSVFAKIHPGFRTPVVSILTTSAITLVLAVSGSFTSLAPVSALARLIVYVCTCASVIALRRLGPAPFTIPGGLLVPVVGLVGSVAIIGGATAIQLQVGGAAIVVGAMLFWISRQWGSR